MSLALQVVRSGRRLLLRAGRRIPPAARLGRRPATLAALEHERQPVKLARWNRHMRTSNKRVLIIVENESVPFDRRVWNECLALVDAGYGVSVVCPTRPGDPLFEIRNGVHLHKFPAPPVVHGKLGFVYEYAYAWTLTALLTARVLVKEGIDALQACNPPDIFFTIGWPLKLLGKRFVFDHHDLSPEMFIARFGRTDGLLLRCLRMFERATFAAADVVIATNESFREIAVTRGRRDPASVVIVRNGPDLSMRRGFAHEELKSGRQFLCCWLGFMGPLAGLELALKAAHHLIHVRGRTDCQFALLGGGELYPDMCRLATDLGLDDWVTFTGWADDDTWSRYFSTADIGLHPNPSDPKNDRSTMIKAMEYMAFELPIVAFDLVETRVSAGEAAVYAPPNDFVVFAELIDDLLDDSEKRRTMARVGRERIEAGLSWDHQRVRYIEAYQQLLGPPAVLDLAARQEQA
jgi:glycosyltransferase involved in cell wall biosynthesis